MLSLNFVFFLVFLSLFISCFSNNNNHFSCTEVRFKSMGDCYTGRVESTDFNKSTYDYDVSSDSTERWNWDWGVFLINYKCTLFVSYFTEAMNSKKKSNKERVTWNFYEFEISNDSFAINFCHKFSVLYNTNFLAEQQHNDDNNNIEQEIYWFHFVNWGYRWTRFNLIWKIHLHTIYTYKNKFKKNKISITIQFLYIVHTFMHGVCGQSCVHCSVNLFLMLLFKREQNKKKK